MNFKLDFKIAPFVQQIKPDAKLFFAGSCFSENIASIFSHYKFHTQSNTHGILYNPISIASSLSDCLHKRKYTQEDLVFANECWNSFQHHSRFSHTDAGQCLTGINEQIEKGHLALKKTDFLFITFGSAFAYKHSSSGTFVGNCHKIPQKEFQKILLSKEEIVAEYSKIITELKKTNPALTLVFTVSPVRYIRDGVAENNLSKAILLQAVHELVAENNNCLYFPAYEIVNDELRDYRFFEEDLVHPNKLAIQYVWGRLLDAAFSSEARKYISELDAILKAHIHRPFNPDSESHKKFKQSYLQKCSTFEKIFPFVDLQAEKIFFGS